jgi:hypothetical protein
MIQNSNFVYQPTDHESEKASNSYLMSLVALVAGLPLPIINFSFLLLIEKALILCVGIVLKL